MSDPRDPGFTGALMFARFAYPPNALGLCGPNDSTSLLEYGADRQADLGLRQLAQGFEGAWPYLQLIAAANNVADPLDLRVVEAYWIGNELLDRVPIAMLGNSLDDRFRRRAARSWNQLVEVLEVGARPHHNFHVLSIYPWVGLLNQGPSNEPLRVLDQCRIRWGTVERIVGDEVIVRGRSLAWNGSSLSLDPAGPQTVKWRRRGYTFVAQPRPGDRVAMHWDWLCQVLESRQINALRSQTALQLSIANDRVAHSGPAATLT
ncbi:MAG: DUF6390 family protein [Candidatus Nanopelagicales bacterium]